VKLWAGLWLWSMTVFWLGVWAGRLPPYGLQQVSCVLFFVGLLWSLADWHLLLDREPDGDPGTDADE